VVPYPNATFRSTLNTLWPGLEFDPGLGLERISLRLGMNDEIMLVLESEDPEPPELEIACTCGTGTGEIDLSLVHLTGEDAVVMAGDEALNISVKDRMFRVSAASFFPGQYCDGRQDGGTTCLSICRFLQEQPCMDVYCGVGLFSAFFAGRVGASDRD